MGSPMEMNGGSVIAMTGKDCVAIASDLRIGQQAVGLTADFEKVSLVGDSEAESVLGYWSTCEAEDVKQTDLIDGCQRDLSI